jgi:hypothetical protein
LTIIKNIQREKRINGFKIKNILMYNLIFSKNIFKSKRENKEIKKKNLKKKKKNYNILFVNFK